MKPTVASWLAEVEELSGGRTVIVPVETDRVRNTISIPPLFPGRDVVRELLMQESFVAQFIRAHALTVNTERDGQRFHFVLLNMDLADQWEAHREHLLAHEAGHLWLNALGYRSLNADPSSPRACIATHAADIVQHVLIRHEMRRRGFDMSFWIHNQQAWLKQLGDASRATVVGCERAQAVSLWVDGALGLNAELWPGWNARTREAFPDLVPIGERIARFLNGMDLWDRSLYEAALAWVLAELQPLV